MFILRNCSKEVRIVLSIVTGDASLCTVADHDSPEVFGDASDGLHGVGAGGPQHPHRGPEPGVVLGLDDVDEPLHDHVRLALAVVDAQHQLVVGQDAGVIIDILHCHLCNCGQ